MAVDEGQTGEAEADATGVRQRLLNAAEAFFSDRGFENTSVRDLARAAKCNVAAVNYYFGSKEQLYVELWRRELQILRNSRLASIRRVMEQPAGQGGLEQLLSSYSAAFIEPLADAAKGQRLMRLMAREIVHPRLPEGLFLNEMIKPVMDALQEALLRVCPGVDRSRIPLLIVSLIGQLLHVLHIKAMFDRATEPGWPKFSLDEAVRHVVEFSAAGIRAFVREETQ